MPTPTQLQPLPPVPAAPAAAPGQPAPPLDTRWLELLRRRLNASLTGLLFQSINGFGSTVTTDSSTGRSTVALTVTASGVLKGSAGALVAATPGTDYLQSITASLPLAVSATAVPNISIRAATSAQSGHLTAADHALFTSRAAAPTPQYPPVAAGFTLTVPAGCSHLYLTAAAVVASGSLALPTAPADAATVWFACTHAVTAFTNTPNPGQTVLSWPASLTGGVGIHYIYRAANSTWYRLR